MRILFVGGCADGKWEEVEDPPHYVRRVLKLALPQLPKEEIFLKCQQETLDVETYLLKRVDFFQTTKRFIYIKEGQTDEETFRLLINNYRPIV